MPMSIAGKARRAGKLDELADYLVSFIERLAKAGAQRPCCGRHAAHRHRAGERAHPPAGPQRRPIAAELERRQIARVALYGTIFTMQGSLWGQLKGVEIVKPNPEEMAFVGHAYQRILDTQTADPADAAELRRIAAALQARDGVEAILLAGTDLAVMFDEATAGFPAIDVARLHIEAIVERLAS